MTVPPTLGTLLRAGQPAPCAGCRRVTLSPLAWQDLPAALRRDPALDLPGLWADATHVHALLGTADPAIASVPVEAGIYAALSPARPAASLFERAVADLWGHLAADAADDRPWLDHGTWPVLHPMAASPPPNTATPEPPSMTPAPGTLLPFGPLPPTPLDAPAHWRATLGAGIVTALEARGGYGHRGVLAAMRGKSPAAAARLAARISGAATVAHATAFARAVEAALDTPAPPRAAALRTAYAAIERVAVALHDMAATASALDRPAPALHAARDRLLAASHAAAGHRLLMDAVRPGGTEPPATLVPLENALEAIPASATTWPPAHWPSGLGTLSLSDALALTTPGPAGRASGRPDPAAPGAPVDTAGDLRARMRLRAAALAADVALALQTLATLPDGPAHTPLPAGSGEALAHAKGPAGRVWHWVRLHGGVLEASFAIDPATLLLPAFGRAAPGTPPALLPAVAASFGLHLPGMEL